MKFRSIKQVITGNTGATTKRTVTDRAGGARFVGTDADGEETVYDVTLSTGGRVFVTVHPRNGPTIFSEVVYEPDI